MAVKSEMQLASTCIYLLFKGFNTVGKDIALEIVNEIDLILIEMTIFSLKLSLIKAYIGNTNNELDNVCFILGIDKLSFSNLHKLWLEMFLSAEERRFKSCSDSFEILVNNLGENTCISSGSLVEDFNVIINVKVSCLSQLLDFVNDLTDHSEMLQFIIRGKIKHDTHVKAAIHSKLGVLRVFLVKSFRDLEPSILDLNSHNGNLTILQILDDFLSSKVVQFLLKFLCILVLKLLTNFSVLWLRKVLNILSLIWLDFEFKAVELILNVLLQQGQVSLCLLISVNNRNLREWSLD